MAAYAVLQSTVLQGTTTVSVDPGANVLVQIESSGANASLFTDSAMTVSTGNPVSVDSNGFFRVYLAPGEYKITITGTSGSNILRHVRLISQDYVTPQMFGAVGDGTTDDSAAVQAMYDSIVAGGGVTLARLISVYALGATVQVLGDGVTTVGASEYKTGFKAAAALGYVEVGDGAAMKPQRVLFERVFFDGNEYTGTHCLRWRTDIHVPKLRDCVLFKSASHALLVDGNVTAWRVDGCEIGHAGEVVSGGAVVNGNIDALRCYSVGEIHDTFLSNATGYCLHVIGTADQVGVTVEEDRVSVFGGRLNKGYEGLAKVDGTVHASIVNVLFKGTYFENPGQVGQSTTFQSVTAAVLATGAARVSIDSAAKFQIYRAKSAVLAEAGSEITVDPKGHPARAQKQSIASSPEGEFLTAKTGGVIRLRSWPAFLARLGDTSDSNADGRDDLDGGRNFRNWKAIATSPPQTLTAGMAIIPESLCKLAPILDGTDLTGVLTSAGSVALDTTAGNFLTSTGSIKLTGDGSSSVAWNIHINWTPPSYLVGRMLMFHALAMFEQVGAGWGGGTGSPTPALKAKDNSGATPGTYRIFPEIASTQLNVEVAAPGSGAKTDWWSMAAFAYVENGGELELSVVGDTRPQVRDDIMWIDQLAVYAVGEPLLGLSN